MYNYWMLTLFILCSCSDDEVTVENEEHKEGNATLFVPTSEWQHLDPGQAIPAGLHVRMNLQTGEKEAKLIDEEEGDKIGDRRRRHHYGYSDRRGIINKQTRAFKAEELFEASHVDSNDVKLLTHDVANIYDNNDGYKLGLATDDVKQIMKLVHVLEDSSSDSEHLIFALSELEYLVHQIDNARDLDIIGGLQLVVQLLRHDNDTVKCYAAHVIGAAAQSNLIVQEACVKYGSLVHLTMILLSDKDDIVHRRAVYALSALLRMNRGGLYNFTFVHHGFDAISKATLMQRSSRYQLKVVTLIADLLSEEAERFRESGETKWLLNHLTTSGWCELVSYLLPTNCVQQYQFCESVVMAMLLLEGCDYTGSVDILEQLKSDLITVDHAEVYEHLIKLIHRISEQDHEDI